MIFHGSDFIISFPCPGPVPFHFRLFPFPVLKDFLLLSMNLVKLLALSCCNIVLKLTTCCFLLQLKYVQGRAMVSVTSVYDLSSAFNCADLILA